MRRLICGMGIILLAASVIAAPLRAQGRGGQTRQFIKTDAPVIALTHVKVIDGTGAAPSDDQTIVISGGKIAWIGSAAQANIPSGRASDGPDRLLRDARHGWECTSTCFNPAGGQYNELSATAPKLLFGLWCNHRAKPREVLSRTPT